MRFFWQHRQQEGVTLEKIVAASQDDVARLLARSILSLQVRTEATQADVRPLIGRIDVLEGRDNSTMGTPRGESFQQIHNQIDALNRRVTALQSALREREEPSVG